MTIRSLLSPVIAVTAMAILPGCTTATPSPATDSSHGHMATNEVNGEVPPGEVAEVVRSSLTSDTDNGDGTHTVVFRDVRAAGTRTPVHVHPHSGVTCIIRGQMTLFLEGAAPRVANPGDCYDMPQGPAMAGYNSGPRRAVFTDTFTVPQGESVWDVIEPGAEDMEDQFASSSASPSAGG